jgi:hypothetical protein
MMTAGHSFKTWAGGELRYFQHKLFHRTSHLMDEGRCRPPSFTRFHNHYACLPASFHHSHRILIVSKTCYVISATTLWKVCMCLYKCQIAGKWAKFVLLNQLLCIPHRLWANISDYVVHTALHCDFRFRPRSRWTSALFWVVVRLVRAKRTS